MTEKIIEILKLAFWVFAAMAFLLIAFDRFHEVSTRKELIRALDDNTKAYEELTDVIDGMYDRVTNDA